MTIKVQTLSWDDAYTELLAAATGRNGPDVISGGIWWRIALPLPRPALAAMSIFIVLAEWNNFLWPLVIVRSDERADLPVAPARLNSYYSGPGHQGAIVAGGLLASLPTIVFFLLFQRYFVRGIALSGLKG